MARRGVCAPRRAALAFNAVGGVLAATPICYSLYRHLRWRNSMAVMLVTTARIARHFLYIQQQLWRCMTYSAMARHLREDNNTLQRIRSCRYFLLLANVAALDRHLRDLTNASSVLPLVTDMYSPLLFVRRGKPATTGNSHVRVCPWPLIVLLRVLNSAMAATLAGDIVTAAGARVTLTVVAYNNACHAVAKRQLSAILVYALLLTYSSVIASGSG